jgi:hypothetical protein
MSEELLKQSLSPDYFWSAYARVAQLEAHNATALTTTLHSLFILALMIGFMLAAFQAGLLAYRAYRADEHPLPALVPYVFRLVLVAFLISPPVYRQFVRLVIAKPADAAADLVTLAYYDRFMDSVQSMMAAFANSNSQTSTFFSALLDGSLISTALAMLVFWVASILLFLMPLLQSSVFLYLFYVGPVCLVFSLCDLTANVAKAWLGLAFAVAWTGFFGSLSFLAGQSLGLFAALGSGSAAGDVVIVFVYGVLSIILFGMAFPIAAFFFDGTSALGKLMRPGTAVANAAKGSSNTIALAGASAMAFGAAASASGSLLSTLGGTASGQSLQAFGEKSRNLGITLFEASQPGAGLQKHNTPSTPTAPSSSRLG